jgi:hypothetical protein
MLACMNAFMNNMRFELSDVHSEACLQNLDDCHHSLQIKVHVIETVLFVHAQTKN